MLVIQGIPSPVPVHRCETPSEYMMRQVLCNMRPTAASRTWCIHITPSFQIGTPTLVLRVWMRQMNIKPSSVTLAPSIKCLQQGKRLLDYV